MASITLIPLSSPWEPKMAEIAAAFSCSLDMLLISAARALKMSLLDAPEALSSSNVALRLPPSSSTADLTEPSAMRMPNSLTRSLTLSRLYAPASRPASSTENISDAL